MKKKQSDRKSNQPSGGEERENPQINPGKPANPAKPDENPDPSRQNPGVNEPEKNDPTRIEESPPIFNNN